MPPPNLQPQTPKQRASSSSIMGSFRNLLGQKRSQSPSTKSSILFVDEEPSGNHVAPNGIRKSQPRRTTEPANLAQIVGDGKDGLYHTLAHAGPPELSNLISRLGDENGTKDRCKAAKSVIDIIRVHKLQEIGAIWQKASDLLDYTTDSSYFDTGLELFHTCLECDDLPSSDRRLLFDTIAKQLPSHPAECIGCMKLLSNNGRNFESLDMSRVAYLLEKLSKSSYDSVVHARKLIKTAKAGSSAAEYALLTEIFSFMTDSVKFSASMFSEAQLDSLLEQVLQICVRTSIDTVIEQALEFVEAIVTYATLPLANFHMLLEVLCGAYEILENCKERAQSVIWKLLGSHLSSRTLEHMLSIVIESQESTPRKRGAIKLFKQILDAEPEEIISRPELITVLSALSKALLQESVGIEIAVLDLLLSILNRPELTSSLLEENTWQVFTKLLGDCAYGAAAGTLEDVQRQDSVVRDTDTESRDQDIQHEVFTKLMQDVRDALLKLASTSNEQPLANVQDVSKSDGDQARPVMTVLLRLARFLDEATLSLVMDYHISEQLHLGPQDIWFETCRHIRKGVLEDKRRSLGMRLLALELQNEAYSTAVALSLRQSEEVLKRLMNYVENMADPALLRPLCNMIVDVATWTDNADLFDAITERLQSVLLGSQGESTVPYDLSTLRASSMSPQISHNQVPEDSSTTIIAKALVRIFLRTLNKSLTKADKLYGILINIATSSNPPADARVIALKVLVRLRSDINHAVFVVPNTESQSLAASLCRTADSIDNTLTTVDNPTSRPVTTDDASDKRPHQGPSGKTSSLSRANSSGGRPATNTSRMTRPTPPLWLYPGPKGLPEDPSPHASHIVFSHIDDNGVSQVPGLARRGVLDIGKWLEAVLELLNNSSVNWEILSYLIVHLGAQLSNHSLFVDAIPQIKDLCRLVCEKVGQKTYVEPPAFSNLKKSDTAVCFCQILTMLISYNRHFHKDDEQDGIVKALIRGIGSYERSSEICIHGLSICCHETPALLIRYLGSMLQTLSGLITQSHIAAPALEFLAQLARLPELFRNFRDEDFKTVFGICFRYLQNVRDQQKKQLAQPAGRTGRTSVQNNRISREVPNPMESIVNANSLGETLPQYVYALTYHVMTFWFMALRLQDRPAQINWIVQNLTFEDDNGRRIMEEQGQVTIDMMYRVAYSDHDETNPDPNFAQAVDGHISTKSYLLGTSILTVETAGRTGASQITTRRPSGTMYLSFRPQIAPTPRHQAPINIGLAAETFYSDDYVGITPDHIVQMMYSPFTVLHFGSLNAAPIPLPDDEATRRAIATFDRTPALDGHKVGIIYVGEGQTTEAEILANVMGSADYMSFLNGIGVLTELKSATFNMHGLDREFDTDGKFTYCWRDRVTEVIFHVTTMMPTDLDRDPKSSNKKRHTGNDFVNIIFNNSGLSFDFDTFPSDFNYVNIVITPEAKATFVETRMHSKAVLEHDRYYKVTVMTKPGLPKISAAAEAKIISGSSLPAFVRLIAINASVFCQVWSSHGGGEHVSSWRSRLRAIDALRARHSPPSAITDSPTSAVTQDTGSSPPPPHTPATDPQRGSLLTRRISVATLFSDSSTNRLSGLSTAGDGDRSPSSGSQDR